MTNHDMELERGLSYDCYSYFKNYKGINIARHDMTKKFHAYAWDYCRNQHFEMETSDIGVLEAELDNVLSGNYYETLKAITNFFEFEPDYNNPVNHLENLRVAIINKVSNAI